MLHILQRWWNDVSPSICFFTLEISLPVSWPFYLDLYFFEYNTGLLHNVVQGKNATTWCRQLSLTFCQTLQTWMQMQQKRGTSFSDPTCHSSWSRPASSLSSPAWWSLRSWARRRSSAVACPFQPRSAQSRSGWSVLCASYHCSRHTPGSLLRRDCTLRWTEGLSQLTSEWIKMKRRKRGQIVWVVLLCHRETSQRTRLYHHAGTRPSLGGLHSMKAEPQAQKCYSIVVVA